MRLAYLLAVVKPSPGALPAADVGKTGVGGYRISSLGTTA
jgi:hypothetical protein